MKSILVLTLLAILVCASLVSAQTETRPAELAVTEHKIGKNVVDRELVDESATFAVNERVYLWMRITGGPADSVAVTWSVDDYTWTTNLHVGASTWRTWAYKTVWKAGEWKVTVADPSGNILLEKSFTVTP